ncbi:hypothetical protein PRUPE_3G224300 [Prunus persica]|uniref:At1g61320/AtMIF1 LRR domain-containing protein n=1 Tax=Prunus persica TaxID=3760 RepID=A0A251Q426_PRUPE|nr:hypothetical protein PRUPE_3G224300 [Prunus persica]
METRAAKKRRLLMEQENKHNLKIKDGLSDLPDDVLHHTLSFLPIKSAAHTSTLSKSWLLDWVPCLVKHRVEKLVLYVWLVHSLDLPCSLFECNSLRSLTLEATRSEHCLLINNPDTRFWLPSSCARATSGLRSLSLTGVDFAGNVLFSDPSSFPSLEKLTVDHCRRISHLKICCANLKCIEVCNMGIKSLDISGMKLEKLTVKLCFNGCGKGSSVKILAPNLQTFCWNDNDFAEKCLIQSFPKLMEVGSLCLSYRILEILSKIYLEFGGLPYSFMNLKTLQIYTDLRKADIPAIACIFRSSPAVRNLTITITAGCDIHSPPAGWENQAQSLSSFLCHLKVVNIVVWTNTIHESVINVVRFLLQHGRALQKFVISSWHSKVHDQLATLFPRASTRLEGSWFYTNFVNT